MKYGREELGGLGRLGRKDYKAGQKKKWSKSETMEGFERSFQTIHQSVTLVAVTVSFCTLT